MTIGKKIKHSRESLDYSMEFLAFNTGISLSSISKIEFGEILPNEAEIKQLAFFLGLEEREIRLTIKKSEKPTLDDHTYHFIKKLYLATFLAIVFPFFNILATYFLYRYYSKSLILRLICKNLMGLQTFFCILGVLGLWFFFPVLSDDPIAVKFEYIQITDLLCFFCFLTAFSNLFALVYSFVSLKRKT